jgi:hypothetical protein
MDESNESIQEKQVLIAMAELLKAKIVIVSEHGERMFPTVGDVEYAAGVLNVEPAKEVHHVTFEDAKGLFSKDDGFITSYSTKCLGDEVYVAFQKVLESLIIVHKKQMDMPVTYPPGGALLFPIYGSGPNYLLPTYMAHHMAPDNFNDPDYIDVDVDHLDCDSTSESDVTMEVDKKDDNILSKNQKVVYLTNGKRIMVTILNVHYDDWPPYYTIDVEGKEKQTVRSKLVVEC